MQMICLLLVSLCCAACRWSIQSESWPINASMAYLQMSRFLFQNIVLVTLRETSANIHLQEHQGKWAIELSKHVFFLHADKCLSLAKYNQYLDRPSASIGNGSKAFTRWPACSTLASFKGFESKRHFAAADFYLLAYLALH